MSQQDGWWTTFFQGVRLEFWSRAVSEKQTEEEADFLQRELGVAAGGRVLDVPGGNGRLAWQSAFDAADARCLRQSVGPAASALGGRRRRMAVR
jgi:hypothetical protein